MLHFKQFWARSHFFFVCHGTPSVCSQGSISGCSATEQRQGKDVSMVEHLISMSWKYCWGDGTWTSIQWLPFLIEVLTTSYRKTPSVSFLLHPQAPPNPFSGINPRDVWEKVCQHSSSFPWQILESVIREAGDPDSNYSSSKPLSSGLQKCLP
jgi:hypothetical protein